MCCQTLKTGEWFSSPRNFRPEASKPFDLRRTVRVHEVTLRDGELQTGLEFSAGEKVRIHGEAVRL
jgi:hypothetical protein